MFFLIFSFSSINFIPRALWRIFKIISVKISFLLVLSLFYLWREQFLLRWRLLYLRFSLWRNIWIFILYSPWSLRWLILWWNWEVMTLYFLLLIHLGLHNQSSYVSHTISLSSSLWLLILFRFAQWLLNSCCWPLTLSTKILSLLSWHLRLWRQIIFSYLCIICWKIWGCRRVRESIRWVFF